MTSKDIVSFMHQLQIGLASEYSRIQERAIEDPGTAGDEGEENWAALLREWLPANYTVVTKGRIINVEGEASPQVDILVLHPAYPKHLINKKHYLAGGVVAAFECKLTLRIQHIKKAFSTSCKVKRLLPKRKGTPYKELTQPIIYGLLAHSHNWKGSNLDTALSLLTKIKNNQFNGPEHPSELVDILCIADLATYNLVKCIDVVSNREDLQENHTKEELYNHISTAYDCSWNEKYGDTRHGTVLGAFVSLLMNKIAYEDSSIRSIAEYYREAMEIGGIGITTVWYLDLLSENVIKKLKFENAEESAWSEWEHQFY